MKLNSKLIILTVLCLLFYLCVIATVLLITGCLNPVPAGDQLYTNPTPFGPEWLDSMIEIAKALSFANMSSAPVNPFVLPIGVGFAGLTAVLEALRRKEKSGRKHAEHVLNTNGNDNT